MSTTELSELSCGSAHVVAALWKAILLTDEVVPPPALIRAGLDAVHHPRQANTPTAALFRVLHRQHPNRNTQHRPSLRKAFLRLTEGLDVAEPRSCALHTVHSFARVSNEQALK
jgi:hypothetical protein